MTTLKVILIAMVSLLSNRMATGVVAEEGLYSGASPQIQVTSGPNYPSARFLFNQLFGVFGALTDTAGAVTAETAAVVAEEDDDDEEPPLRNCSCNCGVPNQEIRIVGGRPTGVNRYPWIARLIYDGQFHCGGSLLNSDYVITAAHCVRRLRRSKMRIVLGDHDMHSTTETPIVSRTVSAVIRHRNFDLETYNHDIALLRLRKTVSFTKRVRPVCLPKGPSTEPAGKIGTVVGWGRISEGGVLPSVAQEVQVPILSLDQCRFDNKYRPSRITSYMICAGKGSQDSCQGDSGGPLLVQSGGKFEIVGIVSWGVGCGRPGYPGVYTRVTRYLEWMQKNMKDTCLCSD